MIIIVDIQEGYSFKVVKILPKFKAIESRKKRNPKKKTQEQYVQEVADINPNLRVLGEYVNHITKIDHECLICGYIWNVAPAGVLRGNQCKNCMILAGKYKEKKTHEQYIEELFKVDSTLEVLEEYQGANKGILHRCKKCGNTWKLQPANALSGYGCRNCKCKENGLKRRKTNEQYIEELKLINPNVIPLEPYIKGYQKILHKCLVCLNTFKMKPDSLLQGTNCPECAKKENGLKRRKTQEQFVQEVYEANPNNIIIGNYITSQDPIETKCSTCGYIWFANPSNLLAGHSCPKCADKINGLNSRKTNEQYTQELATAYPNIVAEEEYIGADKSIMHHCTVCDYMWLSRPVNVLSYGCPKCNGFYSGESKIEDFLTENNIEHTHIKRFDGLIGVGGKPLSYDFYLPSYNTLIEFQGAQHEHPVEYFGGEEKFKTQQEHDRRKREYAKDHNINLLEIWYYDYNNIEEILTNYLNLETVETVIPA